MWSVTRVRSRRKILLGSVLITLGLIAAIVSELRTSSLVETSGLITFAMPHSTSAGPRLMHYQYAANGRRYSGEAWLPDTAIENKTGPIGSQHTRILQANPSSYELRRRSA